MEKKELQSIISFRITQQEKMELEKITEIFKTNKSEFIRDWLKRLLSTIKN